MYLFCPQAARKKALKAENWLMVRTWARWHRPRRMEINFFKNQRVGGHVAALLNVIAVEKVTDKEDRFTKIKRMCEQ